MNVETDFDEITKDVRYEAQKEGHSPAEEDVTTLCLWMKNELQPVVSAVQLSKWLTDSLAIVVGSVSSGMRQVMSMIDKDSHNMDQNMTLEINPNHHSSAPSTTSARATSKWPGSSSASCSITV